MKCLDLNRSHLFQLSTPMEVGLGKSSKNLIARNWMKCLDLHRVTISKPPTLHPNGGEIEEKFQKKKNNC